MSIVFRCPECGQELKVGDASAGKKAACPSCEAVVRVPLDDSSQLLSPDPAPAGGGSDAIRSTRPEPAPPSEDERRQCTGCGKRLLVPAAYRRKTVKCPA